jgi:chromosome segregation ATPase
MAANGTDGAIHLMVEQEGFGMGSFNGSQDESRDHADTGDEFRFAPLVNRIAFGIARELAAVIKQLEDHIGGEVRRLGESVEHRLDSLQTGLLQIDLPELSRFAGEQRNTNSAVQDQLQQLTTADAGLWEANNRQAAELETLRAEARDFSTAVSGRFDAVWERIDNISRNLGARQEEIAATKTTLDAICSRADAFVERLDRQADAVRSLHSAWSQRDAELEQIVDVLARLRANPKPPLANEL